METKQVIEKHLDDFTLGYWDEKEDEWYKVDDFSNEEMAEKLSCSPEVVDFIRMNFTELLEQLTRDLEDLWNQGRKD